jgi:hypothetical protein
MGAAVTWGRRGHVIFAGALVALLAASPPETGFTKVLPPGVPDLGRWSKSSGSAETEDGTSLQYELYYHANRSNYEVIRYRVTGWKGGGGPPYSSNERLQWQVAQKDLRRFECEPRQSGGCAWKELDKKAPEYHRELPIILWLLSVHNQLLHKREDEAR